MGLKDVFEKALKDAKELAHAAGDSFLQKQWPLVEEKLISLSQSASTGWREFFGEHWPKVQIYFDQKASPNLVDLLKNDNVFDVIIEVFHDTLPRTLRRRLKPESLRQFCQGHRAAMISRLQSSQPRP